MSARSRIEAAALELFTKQGFDATTVDEIAAAANVGRASVFRYFGAKEGMVFELEGRMLDHLVGLLRERPERSVSEVLLAEAAYFDTLAPDFFARAAVIASTPRLMARFTLARATWDNAIANELAARRKRPDAVPRFEDRVQAAVAMTALFVPLLVWARTPDAALQDLVASALAVVLVPLA